MATIKQPFGAPVKEENNQTKIDDILTKALNSDEIPPNQKIIDGIKTGVYNFDDVKNKYTAWKNKQGGTGIVTQSETKQLNKPEDIYNTAIDRVTNPVNPVNKEKSFYNVPEYTGNVLENIQNTIKNDFDSASYIAKKFASGLTFDIYDTPDQSPDVVSGLVGTAAKLTGMALTGWAIGAVLPAVPVIGPAIAGLSASAKTATGAAKFGKEIAAIAAEGAAIGFGAGAIEGAIKGDGVGDVLSEGAITAAEFAAGGALLYPVFGAVGKGLEKYGRIKFGKRAEAMAGKVEELVKQEPQYYIEKLSAMEQTPEIQEALRYANAALKIKATDPMMGPMPIADKIRDPKAIEAIYKAREEDLGVIAKAAFTAENAPLKSLYDSEPTIKNLVDTGKYAEALSVGQTFFREQVKKNKNIQEFIATPFLQDSKYIYDVLADRVLGKIDVYANPVTSRNLITNYLSDLEHGVATRKDLKTLRDTIAGQDKASRKAFGSIFTNRQKLLDTRLKADEADAVIGKILDGHLQTLAGKKQPFGTIANIEQAVDDQAMLKAAIWSNKQLHSDMVQAYARGINSVDDALIIGSPKAQEGLKDSVRIRTISLQISNDVNRIRELKNQLKVEGLKEVSRKELTALKKSGEPLTRSAMLSEEINTLKGGLSSKYQSINKAKSNLSQLDAPIQAEIERITNEIYIPTKQQLGLQRNQTNELMARFNWKDSNTYLKSGDELVDMINTLNYTGVDMTEAFTRKFNLPFVPNVENYRRIADREFGYNNPISTYLRGIKEADLKAQEYKNTAMAQLKPLGIKRGTKESALLFDFVENKLQQNSEEFLKLPVDLQKKLIDGKETIKGIYSSTLNKINEVMRLHNLPEVAERKNYITHFIESQELYPNLIKQLKDIKDPKALESMNIFFANRKGDPSKTFLSWELPRTGIEHTKDAIGAIEKYLKPAAERIYFTPLVRGLDTARVFATGPNAINFFTHIKENVLLRTPNEWTQASSPGLNRVLEVFQKRLAKGALFGNINTIMQQLASTPLSLAIGGKEALIATVNRFSKDSKELMAMSQNLRARAPTEWADMDARLFKGAAEWANKLRGAETVRAGYNYWQKFTEWGLKTFDQEAASHAFRTGIAKGRANGITDKKSLVALGDAYVDMLQGSFAKADRPFVLDSTLTRALFQFQSFTMNLGATIMTDLPVMAKTEGAQKAIKSLLRTAAGASIVNSIAEENGMPPPFSLNTFLPGGSTFRFGAPGALKVLSSSYQFAAGDKSAKQYGKEMARLGTTLAIPAGGQIYKTAEAFSKRGRKSEKIKGALFGSGVQKELKKEERKERRGFEAKAKKKIKRTFGL